MRPPRGPLTLPLALLSSLMRPLHSTPPLPCKSRLCGSLSCSLAFQTPCFLSAMLLPRVDLHAGCNLPTYLLCPALVAPPGTASPLPFWLSLPAKDLEGQVISTVSWKKGHQEADCDT